MYDKLKLDEYVLMKVKEKHETCLIDDYDNGYFWAMKELQAVLHLFELSEDHE